MKWPSFAVSALMGLVLLSGCGSQKITCLTVPVSLPDNRLLTTDTHLTVPVNAIVWVALVEGPNLQGGPSGFPWVTPITSDRTVVAPLRLCKRTGVSSLPEEVSAFRALRPGTATLTARLAPGWPGSAKPPLQPVLNTVTVR